MSENSATQVLGDGQRDEQIRASDPRPLPAAMTVGVGQPLSVVRAVLAPESTGHGPRAVPAETAVPQEPDYPEQPAVRPRSEAPSP